MNQKQLTEAIEDGINNSFPSRILKTLIIICCVLSILYFIVGFIDLAVPDCLDTGECAIAPLSCFPLENLDCNIVIGNLTDEGAYTSFSICGYQEANAYYEQLKPKINKELKEYESTMEIKYLECY